MKEFTTYNNNPDMILALKSRKTDAALSNNAVGTLAVNRNKGIILFPKNLQDGVFGFAFAKGSPLRDEWQAAYDRIPEETKEESVSLPKSTFPLPSFTQNSPEKPKYR